MQTEPTISIPAFLLRLKRKDNFKPFSFCCWIEFESHNVWHDYVAYLCIQGHSFSSQVWKEKIDGASLLMRERSFDVCATFAGFGGPVTWRIGVEHVALHVWDEGLQTNWFVKELDTTGYRVCLNFLILLWATIGGINLFLSGTRLLPGITSMLWLLSRLIHTAFPHNTVQHALL